MRGVLLYPLLRSTSIAGAARLCDQDGGGRRVDDRRDGRGTPDHGRDIEPSTRRSRS